MRGQNVKSARPFAWAGSGFRIETTGSVTNSPVIATTSPDSPRRPPGPSIQVFGCRPSTTFPVGRTNRAMAHRRI